MYDDCTLPPDRWLLLPQRAGIPASRLRRAAAVLVLGLIVVAGDLSLRADALMAPQLDPNAPVEPIVLDRPLPAADAARYRDIFALQADGRWDAADRLIGALDSELLLGHVLAQRYLHPTAYRSGYRELADWLDRYADHPDAPAIHRLALARKPTGVVRPARPAMPQTSLSAEEPLDLVHPYRSDKRLSLAQARKVQRLKRRIRIYLHRTWLTKTEKLLAQSEVQRLFDAYEIDDARAGVAAGWLYVGKPEKALELADSVAVRSGDRIPTAHWTAGLAAWRLGDTRLAAKHFALLADAKAASAWNRAAGAYWAARAHGRLSDPDATQRWLRAASGHATTFYGLLAQRRLGLAPDLSFRAPKLGFLALEQLRKVPGGVRAMALVQIGERRRAAAELAAFADWRSPQTVQTLLAAAQAAGLPRLGWQVAHHLMDADPGGWPAEKLGGVLYPIPPWTPQDGFRIDRALVYAFMRQESSFDPDATSFDGARGLMQLMPATASALDRKRDFRGDAGDALYDPALNLSLGQRYLRQLLRSRRVDGDLLRLAVAYNAGPGNLGSWQRRMPADDDPLLFLESLPTRETRLFAERVLTNLWIYRLRLGQPTPSLDALAAGRWPAYAPLDPPTLEADAGS